MNPLSKSSHIELDALQFKKNLAFIRKELQEGVQLSAVIKGNAYGHGIAEFVPMAEAAGVSHFSVYGLDEAMDFHSVASESSELMVMGYIGSENVDWVIERGYSFFVYDLYQLKMAIAKAHQSSRVARIHIEVETGMNRTGIDVDAFEDTAKLLLDHSNVLELSGVCTHLAGAENVSNFSRIKNQLKTFTSHIAYFKGKGLKFEKRHAACSAGLIRLPQAQFDMVRVGILLYGFWPNQETMIDYFTRKGIETDPLTSVLSWKTKVMTIKTVKAGEFIGYGTSFLANVPTTIAVVPIGYAYGYARSLSNQGRVLIHGKRMGVIGTVNMNMMAIDITELNNVKHGDEVVLIGFQNGSKISVKSFGEMSSQLNYELLARLPHNIPRIVKN